MISWVWIGTVCGKMKTDFSYSNTLGWNTFPLPACFDNPRCRIFGLDEMNLWEARRFVDFTRYDYLSFGKGEESP